MGVGIGELVIPVVVVVDVVVTPTTGLLGALVEVECTVPGALGDVVPAALVVVVLGALEAVVPEVLVAVAVPVALLLALVAVRLVIIKFFLKLISNNIIVT